MVTGKSIRLALLYYPEMAVTNSKCKSVNERVNKLQQVYATKSYGSSTIDPRDKSVRELARIKHRNLERCSHKYSSSSLSSFTVPKTEATFPHSMATDSL
ncbi:hypothetical protein EMCRGX_G011352 [Ephydatia muelleri]